MQNACRTGRLRKDAQIWQSTGQGRAGERNHVEGPSGSRWKTQF